MFTKFTVVPKLQCFGKKILIYLKYFVSLKSHSELATHRDEPVTLPLNIFGNVMFNGSIADFNLIIIVQARVLMYIYTCIIMVMIQ